MAFNRYKERLSSLRKKEEDLGFSTNKSEESKKIWLRWIIVFFVIICFIFMFPKGRSFRFADMKEGSISTRRIVAPFSFEILKTEEEYKQDRDIAAEKVYPVFLRDQDRTRDHIQQVNLFLNRVIQIRDQVKAQSDELSVFVDTLKKYYPIGTLRNQSLISIFYQLHVD